MKLKSSKWKNTSLIVSRLGETKFDKDGVSDKEVTQEVADHLMKNFKHIALVDNDGHILQESLESKEAKATALKNKTSELDSKRQELKQKQHEVNKLKNEIAFLEKQEKPAEEETEEEEEESKDENKGDTQNKDANGGGEEGHEQTDEEREKEEKITQINLIKDIKTLKSLAESYPDEEKTNLKSAKDWKNYLISKL